MTKNDIRDRVRELVQDKSSEMSTLISNWIDIVINDMSSRALLPSLLKEATKVTLVNATRDYTIDSTLDHIVRVFVPAWGYPEGILRRKSWEEILDLMLEDGLTHDGRPQYYSTRKFENKIRIHPLPNADNAPASPTDNQKLQIYSYVDVTTLAGTDSITEFKLKHTPIIILGAYAMGMKFDSAVDSARAEERYEQALRRFSGDTTFDLERPRTSSYNSL